MSRQRTIMDSVFWRSPKMAGRTQEDRSTLTYLLTSPFSNIIGAYQIVPRIAASEMGWDTESQFMPILRRLQEAGFIEYDSGNSYVWVHIWWDHNHLKVALSPTLRKRTVGQIRELPEKWQTLYVNDLAKRLPEDSGLREMLAEEFHQQARADQCLIDGASMPHPWGIDRAGVNTNSNNKNNTTPTPPAQLKELSTADQRGARRLLRGLPEEEAQALYSEWMKALNRPGHITHSPLQYLHGLVRKHQNGDFILTATATKDAAKIAREQLKAMVSSTRC